jgi:hypothetical protein
MLVRSGVRIGATRVGAGGAVTALALTALVVGAGTPAAASSTLVQCSGTERTTYRPALDDTARPTVASTGTVLTDCRSVAGGPTSGTARSDVGYPARSCADLLVPAPVSYPIRWNTGRTSTVTGTVVTVVDGAAVVTTLDAVITAGLYQGARIRQTVSGAATDGTPCRLGQGLAVQPTGRVTLVVLPGCGLAAARPARSVC